MPSLFRDLILRAGFPCLFSELGLPREEGSKTPGGGGRNSNEFLDANGGFASNPMCVNRRRLCGTMNRDDSCLLNVLRLNSPAGNSVGDKRWPFAEAKTCDSECEPGCGCL